MVTVAALNDQPFGRVKVTPVSAAVPTVKVCVEVEKPVLVLESVGVVDVSEVTAMGRTFEPVPPPAQT